VTASTIFSHLAEAVERGERIDLDQFLTVPEQKKVADAFRRNGFVSLGPVFESLGGSIDYGRLKIFRAAMNASPSR